MHQPITALVQTQDTAGAEGREVGFQPQSDPLTGEVLVDRVMLTGDGDTGPR